MLNYKQLHHFWTVARAGGIVRAAERSGLAPQTPSGQIATLETDLGEPVQAPGPRPGC